MESGGVDRPRPFGLSNLAPDSQRGSSSEGGNPNWQHLARTYRIESTANEFGIPERSWNHSTVHSFVEATLDARDLQRTLTIGDAKHSFVGQLNYAQHGSEPGREVPPGAPGMNPPLAVRYIDGELLLRGVSGMLEYGFGGKPAHFSDYLANKVGIVTRRFGVMVTHLSEEETRTPEVQVPTATPGSAWAARSELPRVNVFDRYARLYGANNVKATWMDTPREKDADEERARLITTAKRLGIPEGNISHSTVRDFVSNLHNMEDLLRTIEQGETPPGAPGLTPSVAERYTMGAHLLHVAVAIMEEGFQGRMIESSFVAAQVNDAVSYFGLQARLQIA